MDLYRGGAARSSADGYLQVEKLFDDYCSYSVP